MGAEPVRRPGEAPREGVSSKNGWGWGGVMREIGALVQGDGWYKEVCASAKKRAEIPTATLGLKIWWAGKKLLAS